MNKFIIALTIVFALYSCNKAEEKKTEPKVEKTPALKTAWIDTKILMDSCQEANDLDKKYELIIKGKASQLESEKKKFQNEVVEAEKSAQSMGPQWVQAKMQEFQMKEQRLMEKEQKTTREIQEQSGKELEALINKVKKTIKDYAKENNYDYIYGTGETSSVLYGKKENDLTNFFIKKINEDYKNNKVKK